MARTSRPETAPGEAPRTAARAPGKGSRPGRPSAATILLLAGWIGLVAGFLDLGLFLLGRGISGEFYRLGEGFLWIIPTGVAMLVAPPGAALAAVAVLRRGAVPLGVAVGLPAFVGFLDLLAVLPLEFWSSSLLAAGLAIQVARMVGPRQDGFLRLVRLTAPALAGAVIVLALATTGARVWSDRRASASLPPPPPAARNVLLIVWDTVRARNLSLHGHGRPTSPHLERLAARGVRFRHAFAASPWTLPSHASLFTGRWPHELSADWKAPLDATHPTLAEGLRSLGYDTAGFVANLDYCGRETGIARGFSHYEDYPISLWEVLTRYVTLGRKADKIALAQVADLLAGAHRGWARPLIPISSKEHAKGAEEVDRAFLDWLSWQRDRGRPFFAFLNYNDAHTPYQPPDDEAPGFGLRPSSWQDRLILERWNFLDKTTLPPRMVQMANDLYDDSIAHLDRRLKALLDELERRGVLEDTVVVVTSDHGEHLGDHGLFFHGCSLYRQLVEVPLVIVDPKGRAAGRVVDAPVSLRDVPATILDLLGLKADAPPAGRSLARFWEPADDRALPASEPLFMEVGRSHYLTNLGREPAAKGPMRGMIAGGMHYIRSGDGSEELFSLDADLEERTNLASRPDHRQDLRWFRNALPPMRREGPPVGDRTAGPAPPAVGSFPIHKEARAPRLPKSSLVHTTRLEGPRMAGDEGGTAPSFDGHLVILKESIHEDANSGRP